MKRQTVFDKIPCLDTHMGPQGLMVTISCKVCGYKEYARLKKLGESPSLYLEKFKKLGWEVKGDGKKAICTTCLEAARRRKEEQRAEVQPVIRRAAASSNEAPPPNGQALEADGIPLADRMKDILAKNGVPAPSVVESRGASVLGVDEAYGLLKGRVRRLVFDQWLKEGKVKGTFRDEKGHMWIPEKEMEQLDQELGGKGFYSRERSRQQDLPYVPPTPTPPKRKGFPIPTAAAQIPHMAVRTLYRYVDERKLGFKDPTGRLCLTQEEIEQLKDEREEKTESPPSKKPKGSDRRVPLNPDRRNERKEAIERIFQMTEAERAVYFKEAEADDSKIGLAYFSQLVRDYLCGQYGKIDIVPDAYGYGTHGPKRKWTATTQKRMVGNRRYTDRFKEDLIRLMQDLDEEGQDTLLESLYIRRYNYNRWEQAAGVSSEAEQEEEEEIEEEEEFEENMNQPMNVDIKKQHKLFLVLNQHYSKEKKGYEPGWSDQRCAKEVGLDQAYVAEVREGAYGPIESAADQLRTEFHQEFKELMELVVDFQKRWETRLDSLEAGK